MTKKTLEGWAKARSMGRSAFVLKFGVIGWGVPTAILWSILAAADEGFAGFPVYLIIALIVFPAGGYLFGRLLWAMFGRSNAASESPSTGEYDANLDRC